MGGEGHLAYIFLGLWPRVSEIPPVEPVRHAVIDVGTNSVKLLVAEVDGARIEPVLECSRQTRLGEGFYRTHQLQPEPIRRTASAVAELAEAAGGERSASVRVIATSAARDAANAQELLQAVEQSAGLRVEIISGDQEADWAYRGAITDPALAHSQLMLLDLGGGSTEVILGHGAHRDFQQSFPLGTVRLMEKAPHSDPPTAGELADCRSLVSEYIRSTILPAVKEPVKAERRHTRFGELRLLGTGGTASILGCMEARLTTFDRARLEATRLELAALQRWVERLWNVPLEERKQIPGLPANRADVILTGAVIYEQIMIAFGFGELRISTRGLRFGALLDTQAGS